MEDRLTEIDAADCKVHASDIDQKESIGEYSKAGVPKKKGLAALWQVIKFGMVGVINTIVSLVVYNLCYHVLHTNEHVANVAGFVVSVFNAFLLQNKFVFKENEDGEKRVWWKVLIKTYISYSFSGLFLTELLLTLWLHVIHIEQYTGSLTTWLNQIMLFGHVPFANWDNLKTAVTIAPLLNMVITIPINFCINKFWAYRQKKKEPDASNL